MDKAFTDSGDDFLDEVAMLRRQLQSYLEYLQAGGITEVKGALNLRSQPLQVQTFQEKEQEHHSLQQKPGEDLLSKAWIEDHSKSMTVRRSTEITLSPPLKTYPTSSRLALVQYSELPDPLPWHGQQGLDRVKEVVGDCKRCKLHHNRNHIVLGQGDPNAALVFVGEGPGAEEDRTGLPFVGAAGDLLNRMIAAMGLKREQVYICNVVKCRPPGNRTPEPDEIGQCGSFLRAQLQALSPKIIVALGATPTRFLLSTSAPMSKVRGVFAQYQGLPVMPTYHPAYLLRTPSAKKLVWEDLKQVIAKLNQNSSSGKLSI